MDLTMELSQLFKKKGEVWVYELGHEIRRTKAVLQPDGTVSAKGKKWLGAANVEPRRIENNGRKALLAVGPEICPWPNTLTFWDLPEDPEGPDDEPIRVRVTPEYLDQLCRTQDIEALLRGVKGISLTDRLLHIGAGAFIGVVAFAIIQKVLGFGVAYFSKEDAESAGQAAQAAIILLASIPRKKRGE